MEDLTELILLQIKSIGRDTGSFVAALLSDDLTKEQQIRFGHRLVDLAEMILERAEGASTIVIEGSLSDDGNDLPGSQRAICSGGQGR